MNYNKIPQQLQKKSIGFSRLRPKNKIPFERGWQNRPYSYTEIQSWVNTGNNYGVLGGYGNLIIIDADSCENLLKNITIAGVQREILQTDYESKEGGGKSPLS